jgi:alpha-L-arabinofuranosidase
VSTSRTGTAIRAFFLLTIAFASTIALANCGGGSGPPKGGGSKGDASANDSGGAIDSGHPSDGGGPEDATSEAGSEAGSDGGEVSDATGDAAPLAQPNAYNAPTAAADIGIYNPNIYFKFLNPGSGLVLSIANGGTDNGDSVVIAADVSSDDQLWSIRESIQGFKKLINKKSGRALSTDHQGTATDGTPAQLWQYLGSAADQDWSIAPGSPGAVEIVNSARAGAVLSLVGASSGSAVDVASDTSAAGQAWVVEPVQTLDPSLNYMLVNKNSNTALSVYLGGTQNDDPADLYSFVNQPDQYWSVIDAGGAYVSFVNFKSGRLLSMTDGQTTDGTIAMIYDNVGATDQGWKLQVQPSGFYQLANERRPTGVLSIVGEQTTSQSQAEINDDGGTPDQSWSIVPVGNAVTVNALDVQANLSNWMTGTGMEDVNHELYGGIYSQMIFGESFQEPEGTAGAPGVSGMWSGVTTGSAAGTFAIGTTVPYQGAQYQTISFTGGTGEVGVYNQGLDQWGIHFAAGEAYDGYVYARTSSGSVALSVAAESATGTSAYATTSVTVNQSVWTRYDFSFTASASDPAGRLTFSLNAPGSVDLGYVYVEPGTSGRFDGLPVRNDIALAMQAQGNTVLRFGGSAVLANGYRWKNMTGPREQRPVLDGWWYAYDTNGWGIFEFLSYAEALGVLGIPTLNIDETASDMEDFVDYVNGPVTTTWGAQRAADGHPAPFDIQRIELGNEELVNDAFATEFNQLAAVIWAKDPTMVLTVGDMGYNDVIANPTQVTGAQSGLTTLEAYQSILSFAAANSGALAIDMHTWTDTPEEVLEEVDAIASLDFWVHQYNPAVSYALNIYELNAQEHDLNRALANARAIGLLEQHGRRVKVTTSANALQPQGHNDNGWDQGLVFFDTQQSWLQPPGYVTQMIAANFLPTVVDTLCTNPDVTVTARTDGHAMTLEVVNLNPSSETIPITFIGYTPATSTLQVTQLTSANLTDENDETNGTGTTLVTPAQSSATYTFAENGFTYTFPGNSFTILRLQ